jgi:pimeloyl-ACP methyl ester carboxylesterase
MDGICTFTDSKFRSTAHALQFSPLVVTKPYSVWQCFVSFILLVLILATLRFRDFVWTGGDKSLLSANKNDLNTSADSFRWSSIIPSKQLQYKPCFGSYQCARLSVPLNWNATREDQESGPRVAVAIIKLAAKVPVTDPRYGGPIILNPGGPGESGVFQVLTDAKNIQTVVDNPNTSSSGASATNGAKYFDILSFDPRGVNNTTPNLHCFPDAFNQHAWNIRILDYGLLWDSQSIIGMEWARAAALGAACSRLTPGTEILPYVNTHQVVEDMVEIIEKEGEWRAREARRLLKAGIGRSDEISQQQVLEFTAYQPGSEKLQYWGMSYGTIIGSTFAAMHPDKVGRVIIDGVVDPEDHYAGAWMTQLQNSDQIITKLSEYCFKAGPEGCELHTGSSPADVEARFTSVMMSLKESPMPLSIPTLSLVDNGQINNGPELITYGDAHLAMLSGMYFPYAMAQELFDLIYSIESRNATSRMLVDLMHAKQAVLSPILCQSSNAPSENCIPYNSYMGTLQSIACMDSGGPTNLTREQFESYLSTSLSQSRWIGPSWSRNKLACLGYSTKPAWRPDLDFVTQTWANTSYPLLIIGNSHDTVTPIRNARRVSVLFPGSVVLHQDSQGHVSHSNPSICTGKAVRNYFQTGELPPIDTICEPEYVPFLGCLKNSCRWTDLDDQRLWDALEGLADPFGLAKKAISNAEGILRMTGRFAFI